MLDTPCRLFHYPLNRCCGIIQTLSHARYASFARQVNGWGFRRIDSGPDYNAYCTLVGLKIIVWIYVLATVSIIGSFVAPPLFKRRSRNVSQRLAPFMPWNEEKESSES